MTRLVTLFALALMSVGPVLAAGPDWYTKVDPWVQEATADGATAEFLVYLTEQADLSAAAGLADPRPLRVDG